MRHDKLEKELRLLSLLTENRGYTVSQLCDRLGMSRRNLYYYIEFFRDSGFHVYKHGNCYCIDRDSPFFNRLIDRVSFTEEEAVLIRRLLDRTKKGNALIAGLKKKLDRFYDFDILSDEEPREQAVVNIRALYDAIKTKRQVVLRGYASGNSRTTRDRLVEPFMLMNGNNEARCYEPASGLNKTFKVSRMRDVEVLDTEWRYEKSHRDMYTDVFMFSSEELHPVTMTLGQLSFNVLREEYPRAEKFTRPDGRGRHLLEMDVCSYVGIGRFVLGLYDDVEVLGDEGFVTYLTEKIRQMSERAGLAAQPASQ